MISLLKIFYGGIAMSKKKLLYGIMNQMGHQNHHNNHHNSYNQHPNQGFQQPVNQGFQQPVNQGFQQPMNQVPNETIANYERQINALKQQLADQEMQLIRKDSQIKALKEQLGFE